MKKFSLINTSMILVLLVITASGCAPKAVEPQVEKVVYLINGALGDNAFYDFRSARHRPHCQGVWS